MEKLFIIKHLEHKVNNIIKHIHHQTIQNSGMNYVIFCPGLMKTGKKSTIPPPILTRAKPNSVLKYVTARAIFHSQISLINNMYKF
jgi:hypothetical protein